MKQRLKLNLITALLLITATLFGQNKITLVITGNPNEKITLNGYDNFHSNDIFNLKQYYAPPFNNASLNSKGEFKISTESENPIWLRLQINRTEKLIYGVLQKNRTYYINISRDSCIASCNIESKYFANEVALMEKFNKIYFFGMYVNFNKKNKSVSPLDSVFGSVSIKLDELPFFKTESNEEAFFKKINSVYDERMDLLEKAYNAKEISEFSYKYFKQRFLYEKLCNNIIYLGPDKDKSEFAISSEQEKLLLTEVEHELKCKECISIDNFSTLLNRYIAVKHSSGYDWLDYRKHTSLYDYIAASTLPEHAKNLALFDAISSNILPKTNPVIYKEYIRKFKNDCTDKYYISLISKNEDEYSSSKLLANTSSLKTYTNASTTLQDVIRKHKGKYVYLNYTYSFDVERIKQCKKLEEKIKDKVAIIHLFFNDVENSWKKSVDDNDLDTNNCYFVTKGSKDDFFDKIRNYALTVFVLFDKNGNIMAANAIDVNEALKTNYFDGLK